MEEGKGHRRSNQVQGRTVGAGTMSPSKYDPRKRHEQFLKMKSDPIKYEIHKKRYREWAKKNRDYLREVEKRRGKARRQMPSYKKYSKKASKRFYHSRNSDYEWRKHHSRLQLELRDRMIDAYGAKCACCGETIRAFLTLGHVNNDGATERKEIGKNPKKMWEKAIKEVDSGRYVLLCWNCNAGAKSNNSVCPHKEFVVRIESLDSEGEKVAVKQTGLSRWVA